MENYAIFSSVLSLAFLLLCLSLSSSIELKINHYPLIMMQLYDVIMMKQERQ